MNSDSKDKAKEIANCLEEHWGLYDGWEDTYEFIKTLI
jgi:hypothetical protein